MEYWDIVLDHCLALNIIHEIFVLLEGYLCSGDNSPSYIHILLKTNCKGSMDNKYLIVIFVKAVGDT